MGISGIGRTALKAIPVLTLLYLVLRGLGGFPRACLSGALIGSLSGDILLDLPYPGIFIFGLVSFLVAHLFYTVLFFRYAKRPDGVQKTTIAALVLLAGAMKLEMTGSEVAEIFKEIQKQPGCQPDVFNGSKYP